MIAHRSSGAPARKARQRSTMGKKFWETIKLRKFGTHVTVRASERPSVQTLGEGEGSHRKIAALANVKSLILNFHVMVN